MMTQESSEDLRYLLEIATMEIALIGVKCHEMRWSLRLHATEPPLDFEGEFAGPGVIRLYDDTLRKTVEQIGNVIHFVETRLNEIEMAESKAP